MFLAGAVAGFATLELHAFVLIQLGLPMWATVITLGLLLMAGLAGFSPHILRWVDAFVALGQLFGLCLAALLIGISSFVFLRAGIGETNQSYKKDQHNKQPESFS